MEGKKDEHEDAHEWVGIDSWRLGEGSYGCVFRVKNGLGQYRALKECPPPKSGSGITIGCNFDVLREINALHLARDPHVIELVQADISYEPLVETTRGEKKALRQRPGKKPSSSQTNPYAYILMEYGEEDALTWRSHVKLVAGDTKSGLQLLQSCFHLLLALRTLHAAKLVHCDIKPENMIRIGERFKLSDFGFALYPESYQWKHTNAFAVGYRAPEILLNARRARFSFPADVWAAAVSMCLLVFGSRTDNRKAHDYGMAPFPIGDTPVSLWKDWITLIGLPSDNWMGLYLETKQPRKGSTETKKFSHLGDVNELWSAARDQGFSSQVTQEQRLVNMFRRVQDLFGEAKIKTLASMLGGTDVFLQFLDLLSKCFQYDPLLRPTVDECLHHAVFSRVRELPHEQKSLSRVRLASSFARSTPSLMHRAAAATFLPAQLQMKELRRYTFEKIFTQLSKFETQLFHKDELIAILLCAINLFDRDFPNFFSSHKPLDETLVRDVVAFILACVWLVGKFLSIMQTPVCLKIASLFSNVCSVADILHFEAMIVNQDLFCFPRMFLNTGFSTSSDLMVALNLHLEHQQDIEKQLFEVLLKKTSTKTSSS